MASTLTIKLPYITRNTCSYEAMSLFPFKFQKSEQVITTYWLQPNKLTGVEAAIIYEN